MSIVNQWRPTQVYRWTCAPRRAPPDRARAHGSPCQAPGPAGVYGAAPPTMRVHFQALRQDDAADDAASSTPLLCSSGRCSDTGTKKRVKHGTAPQY